MAGIGKPHGWPFWVSLSQVGVSRTGLPWLMSAFSSKTDQKASSENGEHTFQFTACISTASGFPF